MTSVPGGAVVSQLGPTVRSARRNYHIVAKPRTRRGSVWMSGLDGPTDRRRAVFWQWARHHGAARAVRRRQLGTRKARQLAELLEGRSFGSALQHSPGF